MRRFFAKLPDDKATGTWKLTRGVHYASVDDAMDAAAPELKSPRRYTNLSAAEFRAALIAKGYSQTELPSERTLRNILNRMIFRIENYTRGDDSDRRPVDPGRING